MNMTRMLLSECSPDLSEFTPLRCSMDPVSLLVGAGGAIASALFGGGGGNAPQAAPAAPDAPPPPQAAPQSSPSGTGRSAPRPQAQTFIGSAATPQDSQSGQHTLLGQ